MIIVCLCVGYVHICMFIVIRLECNLPLLYACLFSHLWILSCVESLRYPLICMLAYHLKIVGVSILLW